jgi:hypothetical protein
MSKKNNVNPDYYKVRGRDRVNEDVVGGKGAPSSRGDIERAAKAAERARERERQAIEGAEKQLDREQKP